MPASPSARANASAASPSLGRAIVRASASAIANCLMSSPLIDGRDAEIDQAHETSHLHAR
jgi:hypothetical protein